MHSFACEEAAHVDLEVWEHMNHDFQAFGTAMPQSAQALRRLGQVIDTALSVSPPMTTNSANDGVNERSVLRT
jgi:hypothetical protein